MSVTLEELEKKFEVLGNQIADKGGEVVGAQTNGRYGAMSYFESEGGDGGHVTAAQLKAMGTPINRGQRRNPRPPGYKSQFKSMSEFLRMGMREENKFQTKYQEAVGSLAKAYGLNSYTGDSGGALVLPEFAPAIMERMVADNDLWSRTDQYTVSGNSMSFPRTAESSRVNGERNGGVRAHWEGEEHLFSSTKPKLDETSLKLSKLAVAVFVTEELLDDASYALEQWVTRIVHREMAFMKGLAITEGTGVKQPLGYLNAPGTITISKESGQAAGTLVAENILNMWARRDASVPTSSLVWTINQDVEPQLAVMALGGNNELVYTPPGGLSSTPYATLQGRPIVPTEFNETLGTKGDIALCAFDQMLSISKGGLNEQTSTHVEFLRDLVCYKFTERLDARPLQNTAITPLKGTNTQSAFIVLETRAA